MYSLVGASLFTYCVVFFVRQYEFQVVRVTFVRVLMVRGHVGWTDFLVFWWSICRLHVAIMKSKKKLKKTLISTSLTLAKLCGDKLSFG